MDGARRGGNGGPGAAREQRHAVPKGDQQQQWRARPPNSEGYSAQAALPGIEAFLYQQAPLVHRCQTQAQQYRQQQPNGFAVQTYPVYNHHAYSERIYERPRTNNHSALLVNNQAGGGESPNLSEFKNIALSRASSSRSSINSSTNSSGSGAVRTQTNYKPRATNTTRVMSGGGSNKVNNTSSLFVSSRPMRTSRYLREVDRRNILRRIENGEKQANLAKEYQVSRAAISNLKQRRNKTNSNNRRENQHEGEHDQSESGGHDDSGDPDGDVKEENDDGDVKEEDDEDSDSQMRQQHQLETEYMHAGVRTNATRMGFDATHESSNKSEHHINHQEEHRHKQTDRRQRLSSYSLKRHAHATDHGYDCVGDHELASRSPYRLVPVLSISQPSPPPRHFDPADVSTGTLFERVTEVTTASMKILFTRLIDQRSDVRSFQTALTRIARLLLEHALSLFPTKDVRIPMPLANTQALPVAAGSYYVGTEPTRPTCALAMSECDGGTVMLREFQMLEPYSGIGFVTLPSSSSASGGGECDIQMPQNLLESNVVLIVELRDPVFCQNVAKALRVCTTLTIFSVQSRSRANASGTNNY